MSVLSKFNKSVKLGIEAGRIDEDKHGPVIEAGRKIARVMDAPEWPLVRGKIDNVSPSVFLKYCEKLGITDIERPAGKEEAKPLRLVGNSKWKKQA